MHRIKGDLLTGPVSVLVVGCGGTGSAVASALPYLHQAIVAAGHPGGLDVTLIDGDIISESNCVRQPFSVHEIGLSKAVVLANRINMFWRLRWKASPQNLSAKGWLGGGRSIGGRVVVIGCVDSRAGRRAIAGFASRNKVAYWLDIGNNAAGGQFVLGEPAANKTELASETRLRTVAELYPEVINSKLDDRSEPSCSAIEALERQEPFVNQVLANHALALLARLFRHGAVSYQGGFVNLETGKCAPISLIGIGKKEGRFAA